MAVAGKWVVKHTLGKGGFGTVFLAASTTDPKILVALKVCYVCVCVLFVTCVCLSVCVFSLVWIIQTSFESLMSKAWQNGGFHHYCIFANMCACVYVSSCLCDCVFIYLCLCACVFALEYVHGFACVSVTVASCGQVSADSSETAARRSPRPDLA